MPSDTCNPDRTANLIELHPGFGFRDDRPDLRPALAEFQQLLNDAVGAGIKVDGFFGDETFGAVTDVQREEGFEDDGIVRPPLWVWLYHLRDGGRERGRIAFEDEVSDAFAERVRSMAARLGSDPALPDWIMSVIAFETGGTFDPAQKNLAGSGAVGLIQFMPSTAAHLLGLDPNRRAHREEASERFAAMDPLRQLDFVEKYFQPYAGRLNSLSDVYMSVLYPAAVGKPQDYVIFSAGIAYRQNSGLDLDKDGKITKREATARVRRAFEHGTRGPFV